MPTQVGDHGSVWGHAFQAMRFDGTFQGVCAGGFAAPQALPLATAPYTCLVVDRAELARPSLDGGGRTLQSADHTSSGGHWAMGVIGARRGLVVGPAATSATTSELQAGTGWHVSTLVGSSASGVAGKVRFYVDGLEQPTWVHNGSPPAGPLGHDSDGTVAATTPGSLLAVGRCGNATAAGGGPGSPVRVAAVACYSRSLNNTERGLVEAALASAYGVVLDGCAGGPCEHAADATCAAGRRSLQHDAGANAGVVDASAAVVGLQHAVRFDSRVPYPNGVSEGFLGPSADDPWAPASEFGRPGGVSAHGALIALSAGRWTDAWPFSATIPYHCFVFERVGDDWVRTVVPSPDPPSVDKATQLRFGASVAVHEGPPALLAVGSAIFQYRAGVAIGRVHVFCRGCRGEETELDGQSDACVNSWCHAATIVDPAEDSSSGFGYKVAFASDASFLAVGAVGGNGGVGCVYLFSRHSDGTEWLREDTLKPLSVPSAPDLTFGFDISVWGTSEDAIILVGAPHYADSAPFADAPGSAYVLGWDGHCSDQTSVTCGGCLALVA